MRILTPSAERVLSNPLAFTWRVLRGFAGNQGLLLAGAIAYYALLSLVPLLILSVLMLSHLMDEAVLIATLSHYLEWLVPSQSAALLGDLAGFLEKRAAIGALLFVSMLFFSSLAFSVVEKSMAVIFAHRGVERRRHFLVSFVLPYSFVLLLVVLLLLVSALVIALQALAGQSVWLFGQWWSLSAVSGLSLYGLGLVVETLIFAALYMIMPYGRTRISHALIGGLTAALLWEATRHVLIWYFATLSSASILYGSLTTSVVVLLSMEVAATLLLLGAQVIAEYERIGLE
ncbi:MAG: ribonuclease R [Betaproteobacteria bacterium HGW-Betaproteobacteria-7]|nr:MAG: ribonuclease R [Betaproteobacteria bacterium HGW-Betaproteobacteria-7]